MAHHKNKTIAANPLIEYLSAKDTTQQDTISKKAEEHNNAKQRVTIHVATDIIDRVKNIVYWEPGLTLTEFAEQAFTKELKRWEKGRGEQYPQRKNKLKGGRPLK